MPRRTSQSWTIEDDGILRQMTEKRASPVRIASKLKRTTTAVIGRTRFLGLRRVTRKELRGKLKPKPGSDSEGTPTVG